MTTGLLLAAGSSTRMGLPKMLLSFTGKSLLQHCIDEIRNSAIDDLVVVTGCYHSLIREILQSQKIAFTENKNWQEGMGSSIQHGINYITENYKEVTEVIILVCDQPHISSPLLNKMINAKQQTGKGLIACAYNNTIGTPVLFDKKYFSELSILEGEYGAKKTVQQFTEDIAIVDFPLGSIDIDTPEDYKNL